MGRRTQAAILTGILAASSTAPAIAAAQEPDQVVEGTVDPAAGAGDPALDPDFDPGGESDDLPFDAPDGPELEPAQEPDVDAPGPLEQEPPTDAEGPVADAGDGSEDTGSATPAPVATVTPTPTPTPTAPDVPESSESVSGSPDEAAPQAPSARRKPKPRHRHVQHAQHQKTQSGEPAVPPSVTPVTPVETAASSEPIPAPAAPALAVATRDLIDPGDRIHVVLADESLWSIARDRLGGEPTVARIAREVNRLWQLNSARIATGDPDLLMVGTKLRLR